MKSLVLLFLFSCISFGCCLRCYQCLSTEGWEDCDDKKTKVTCAVGFDSCNKFSKELHTWGGTLYAKGCHTKSFCKDVLKTDECKYSCNAHCCSDDLCNEAALPMASAIMLLTCVFVAFLR
ncbi:hypothetical protein ACROYT_G008312 [Oculina patagonica]